MKNIHKAVALLCLAAVTMLTACNLDVRTGDYRTSAQWGEVTTKKLDLTGFTSIVVNTSVDVVFTQGDKLKVKVEGNERAIDEYTFTVEGGDDDDDTAYGEGTLVIDNARSLNYNLPSVRLRITAPDIKSITLNSSGDFDMKDSVSISQLAVDINGSGDCDIRNVTVSGDIDLNVYGSGDIVVRKLTATNLNASISGSGDIEIRQSLCTNGADLLTTGSGDIDASIIGLGVRATSQGAGDIDLNTYCDSLWINSQGSGDVEVEGRTATLIKSSTMLGTTTTKKLKAETVVNE